MILIIGSKDEAHSKYLYEKLQQRKIDVEYFDSREYPDNLLISYELSDNSDDSIIKINKKEIPIKDIQGVWWRWFYGIKKQHFNDTAKVDNIVHRECKSALESLFFISQNTTCNWLNSLEAINLHKTKAYQLNIVKNLGIRIPKTLITNNIDTARNFYERNNKDVIYKPVLGGAYTQKLEDSDFNADKAETLKYSPIQLQEFIDGCDIIVYVIGNNVFAAKIEAQSIDFREDLNAQITKVELPEKIKNDCLNILKALKLRYSGIDIRLNSKGEFIFIEANPAPMFIHFERTTGYPITDCLIKELLK